MISGHCFTPGLLELGQKITWDGEGTDHSGAHKAYEFSSHYTLHTTASNYQFVKRPNGLQIRGEKYTLRMAKNDWDKFNQPLQVSWRKIGQVHYAYAAAAAAGNAFATLQAAALELNTTALCLILCPETDLTKKPACGIPDSCSISGNA